ncbi:Glucosylceramidase [Phytophthora nicotianae]|uniref:Glucosylceramidase n=1 Tax=Phytophthora nicotianae TaxID=4792 RepID=A0A0W8CV87_PHYNI|nr:Glucosylceramidase [Phytophthora nicotianae]
MDVPVIDIGALMRFSDGEVDTALLDAKEEALQQIITNVRDAASEWGFFYIANHGLPQHEVDEFQESMRSFFRLPVETKRTILRTASNNRGYVVDELTKNKTDWKECFDFAVLHRESQTWVNVPPRKGTYTINIGDMVQVWSNDKFIAPLHRVVASDKAGRFSAPFFYNPSNHVTVEPIVVKEGEVPNYRPFNWRQYQLNRYQGNYADVGKENQIGDFKIHGPIDVANA